MHALLAAAALFMPLALPDGPPDKRPNIVFFFSDDQHAHTVAALGNKEIKTPNIDKLYERGFHFRNAFCMGGLQGAVCVPSRAMLMTGRSLFRVEENLKTQPLFPRVFSDAGYVTFASGKWHNGPPSFARAFQIGRNIFFGGMSDQNAVTVQDLKGDGTFSEKRKGSKFSSELFADSAIEFIKGYNADRPFLLYIPFTMPHDPRSSPPPYDTMYDPAKLPLPKNYLPVHPFRNGDMTLRDEKLLPWPRTEDAIRKETADYYGSITFMDAQIGRVITALSEEGMYGNTIFVFASDHGLSLGRHGLLGKQNLYDHAMRAPLVFAGPGIPKGGSDSMCYLLDIFPTLSELVKVTPPEGIEGRSLVPLIEGKAKTHRDTLLLAYRDVQRALRTDEWKLIAYPKINRVQLFHLTTDPDEMHDLSTQPGHAERVQSMLAQMEKEQARHGDKAPLRSEKPESPEFVPPKTTAPAK